VCNAKPFRRAFTYDTMFSLAAVASPNSRHDDSIYAMIYVGISKIWAFIRFRLLRIRRLPPDAQFLEPF
jgi:hypothetical protein